MQERRGEKARSWFRSKRVFRRNGDWYFRTREGVDVGPYPSQGDAESGASALTHRLAGAGSSAEAQQILHEFLRAMVYGLSPADGGARPPY